MRVLPGYGDVSLGCQEPGARFEGGDGARGGRGNHRRSQYCFHFRNCDKAGARQVRSGSRTGSQKHRKVESPDFAVHSGHAYKLFELPMHHRDPFDRQIIAQAMAEEILVMTTDRAFGAYKGLEMIW